MARLVQALVANEFSQKISSSDLPQVTLVLVRS
jgi:hypothetical protein